MGILALVDDGIQKNVIILQMLSVIFLQTKKEEKRNSKIILLIQSFCSVLMFLRIKLFYNDLFSVLHYL